MSGYRFDNLMPSSAICHSSEGTHWEKKDHKYVKKVPNSKGGYRYIYNLDKMAKEEADMYKKIEDDLIYNYYAFLLPGRTSIPDVAGRNFIDGRFIDDIDWDKLELVAKYSTDPDQRLQAQAYVDNKEAILEYNDFLKKYNAAYGKKKTTDKVIHKIQRDRTKKFLRKYFGLE